MRIEAGLTEHWVQLALKDLAEQKGGDYRESKTDKEILKGAENRKSIYRGGSNP